MIKRIAIVLLFVVVGVQLIPRNRPEVIVENPNDLTANNSLPPKISTLLKASCYDCHSNETNYPWYTYVVPVSFLIEKDVREGRNELNFSEWETLSKLDKLEKLDDISDALGSDEMPLEIYTTIHSQAKLTDSDKEMIISWTEHYGESLFE